MALFIPTQIKDYERGISCHLLKCIEKCLLPPPETVILKKDNLEVKKYNLFQKVAYVTTNIFLLMGLTLISPAAISYEYFSKKNVQEEKYPKTFSFSWPPKDRGFACSFFQTSGLGTKWSAPQGLAGKCEWDDWMDDPDHVHHKKDFDYKDFFTDVLSDPGPYIKMLKKQKVTAHRFSLEWSVIEPKKGKLNQKAIDLYTNFINKLLKANIKPYITLNHFVLPKWFQELGGFQKIENIYLYLNFAKKAMGLFPQVTNWWSFNELGIKSFQQIREVFPTDIPENSNIFKRMNAAALSTRNMLIAHCKLHQIVQNSYPQNKVGVTHQWLKMDMATGNFLERLVAYYMRKITFFPVYNFFKTGNFSFEIPFLANQRFVVSKKDFEKNDHFLQMLGVQAYPQPYIKMGLNHGKTYPGMIKNLPFFSFGGTCEENGTIMRFGPRWRADAIDEILDEAFKISNDIYISEYGADTRINRWGKDHFELDDQAQAEYLKKLTQRIYKYCFKNLKTIKGIFIWSDLRRQMEWNEGNECKLGLINPIVDKNRKMISWQKTPASDFISSYY